MAIKNKYDYRGGVLEALNVEHTPSDLRNEDEYRKKVLEGFGVEYTDDDINQMSLFREKVVEGLASGSGGGGETWNTVFEGNVTTTESSDHAQGEINANITADTIKVTFNGTEYTCEKKADGPFTIYGDMTYTEYPFAIVLGMGTWYLSTPETGTYTLKIEEPQSGGSSDFSTAKVTVVSTNGRIISAGHIVTEDEDDYLMYGIVEAGEYDVITYKGSALLMASIEVGETITVSGNAETSGSEIYITGDCTITIS